MEESMKRRIMKNGKLVGRLNEETLKIELFEDDDFEMDKEVIDELKSEYEEIKKRGDELPVDAPDEQLDAIEKELEDVEKKIIDHLKDKNPEIPEEQIGEYVDKMLGEE